MESSRIALVNQIAEQSSVRGEQRLDVLSADVGDDDVADLVVDIAEQAMGLHLLRLVAVVVGRADVVKRGGLVPVDQEQVDQRHEALLAKGHIEGVLVADTEDVPALPVHDGREDDTGHLLAVGRRPRLDDPQLEELGA